MGAPLCLKTFLAVTCSQFGCLVSHLSSSLIYTITQRINLNIHLDEVSDNCRPVVAPLRRENKAQDRQSPETGPQPIRSSPLPTFWDGGSALDGPRPEDTGHRTEMGGSSILPLVSQQTAPPSHSQHGFDALHNLLSEPDPTAVSSSVPPNPFPASTFDDFPSSLFDFSILSSRRNSFNSFLPVFPEIPPVTNGEGSAVEGTADQLSSTMSAADQAFWEAALFEGFEQISPVEAYPQAPDTGNVSFG